MKIQEPFWNFTVLWGGRGREHRLLIPFFLLDADLPIQYFSHDTENGQDNRHTVQGEVDVYSMF